MTAQAFADFFGNECGAWQNPCQAYIIALGVNDMHNTPLGEESDIGEPSNSTFAGAYTNIIINLRRKQPKARFFLMTMPVSADETDEMREKREKYSEMIRTIAKKYKYCYVLDFEKYAPVYDEEFKKKFYLAGHLNPMGYMLTARMVESYIDYIIRHNTDDFKQVGFIGTPYHNCNEPW